MRSTTHRRIVSTLGRAGIICLALILCAPCLFSNAKRPGTIVCRENISAHRRAELASKLRNITGWTDLAFDSNGGMQFGGKVAGGSASARALFNQALLTNKIVIIEDASNRQDVAFCRVVPGRWLDGSPGKPPAYVVLIDFADFDHLLGDKTALKAFDVGWGFLHELDHVINDSEDSATSQDTGECESHINQMRGECNLPVRAEYFFKFLPHAEESEFKTRFVRLAFDYKGAPNAKRRRYWVMWDAALVGGLSPIEAIARLKN